MSDHEINGKSVRLTIKPMWLDFPRNKASSSLTLVFSIANKAAADSANSKYYKLCQSLKIPSQDVSIGEPLTKPSILHLSHSKGGGDQNTWFARVC